MRKIKISIFVIFFVLVAEAVVSPQTVFTPQQYEEDFDHLWNSIAERYAYFDQKQTDWSKVREIYRPRVRSMETLGDFIGLLESVVEELYDSHTHLNTNTATSPRLVPSGTDIWAEWIRNKPIITEVRPSSAAHEAGMRAGMQVASINGIAVDKAVNDRVGRSLRSVDEDAKNWALRILLAGRNNEKRRIEIIAGRERTVISIDNQVRKSVEKKSLLDHRRIDDGFGYIRVNNSLGDTDLIRQFDLALFTLRTTKGLILDLRDTPSGGNTTIARGIMGRFIHREMPYQKHSIPAEEREYGTKRSWIELVSPRGDFVYKAPVVILVNHWTGSMGEGLAVGMDGMKRATVVGTKMARLVGATSGIRLPNTGIGVSFPTEKLFHINGIPRESFEPPFGVNLLLKGNQDEEDLIFRRGLAIIRARIESVPNVKKF
jgi:carboxyl-terminal processing protease